jgi:hypothetical protein
MLVYQNRREALSWALPASASFLEPTRMSTPIVRIHSQIPLLRLCTVVIPPASSILQAPTVPWNVLRVLVRRTLCVWG